MDEIAEPVPEMPGEHRDALTSGGGFLGRCHWRLEEVLKARKEVLARVNRENVCKLVDAKVEISLPFLCGLAGTVFVIRNFVDSFSVFSS